MLARTFSSWGRLLGLRRGTSAEGERREHGRVPCRLETTCHPAGRDRGEAVRVVVKNVSRSGTCLLVPRAFRTGELVSVSLPGAPGEAAAEVLACVVRCEPAGDGGYEVGCSFSSALADDDLRRFGEEPVPAEQRGWARFECRARVAYQMASTPSPAAWTVAEVVNISGGGVALRVKDALRVGDLISVELRRDGLPALAALASVVRTAVEEGGRLVGCNFIQGLPEEQVAKLLR